MQFLWYLLSTAIILSYTVMIVHGELHHLQEEGVLCSKGHEHSDLQQVLQTKVYEESRFQPFSARHQELK